LFISFLSLSGILAMLDERKWSPGGLEFQKRVIPHYLVFVYLLMLRQNERN